MRAAAARAAAATKRFADGDASPEALAEWKDAQEALEVELNPFRIAAEHFDPERPES